jgi:pilus assembly protein CpaF
MIILESKMPDGRLSDHLIRSDVMLGSHRGSPIGLPQSAGPRAARLTFDRNGQASISDMGCAAGVFVNNERVVRYGPLREQDTIIIAGQLLRVKVVGDNRTASSAAPPPAMNPDRTKVIELGGVKPSAVSPALERPTDSAGASVSHPNPVLPVGPRAEELAARDALSHHAATIHSELIRALDLRRHDVTRMADAELRSVIKKLIDELIAATPPEQGVDRDALALFVLNEAVGLGILESLLSDDSVTEIMVNGAQDIFVERDGQSRRSKLAFSSEKALMGVIERIVSPIGRRVDESSPLCDARLKDGSRVNIVIRPVALKGPTISIRKFAKHRLQVEDLVGYGSLDAAMVEFLRVCVEQKKNIVISGGTGSGKTTLLNIISNLIPQFERIVTIEDAAELKLYHDNLVTLEARPPNVEGRGHISIRDLVKNALRMRPDRIVVGECRGGEALDMLQAMNTGHDGSLTTAHANSPRDMLARLETMVLMAGMDLPVAAIREQLASAVQIIVQQTRFACGSRKVTSITEITGMERGVIQMQEIFRFQRTGFQENGKVQGYFTGCGSVPTFYEELRRLGIKVNLAAFEERGLASPVSRLDDTRVA